MKKKVNRKSDERELPILGILIQNCNAQWNSVLMKSTGGSLIFVRNNRDIVLTMNMYIVNKPFGTK